MLTSDGPMVIEFNARFGDPETQAVLTRLDTDLVDIFSAISRGDIQGMEVEWSRQSSVCIVMASGGYPGSFERGKPITGLIEAGGLDDVVVFHAGTALGSEGSFLTSGGRVLGVTATADSLAQARNQAYAAVGRIEFEGMHYRTDIAVQAGR
ncbi:MAG TPA: phosphoribosylglycinamide synthetase C domain-containing protein, partial [Blastocatellia bacterium]